MSLNSLPRALGIPKIIKNQLGVKKDYNYIFIFLANSCSFLHLIDWLKNLKLNVLNLALAYGYFIFQIILLHFCYCDHIHPIITTASKLFQQLVIRF